MAQLEDKNKEGLIQKNDDEKEEILNNNNYLNNNKKQVEKSFLHLTCPTVYKIDPTVEVIQQTTQDDMEMFKKLTEKYGENKLNELYPDVLTRFVRGYAHEKERFKSTCERLDHYFSKRDQYHLDTITDEVFENENECLNAWPIYIYGEDKQGHPILYDEIGNCNPAEINKVFDGQTECLKKYRYRFMKRLADSKRSQSQKYKQLIYKHVMVMDMSGFSAGHFGQKYRNLVQEVIGEEQHLFPETLYKLFLINAPFAFRVAWKIIGNFVDPITYKKISVLGGNFLDDMLIEINKDQIPPKYGGNGIWEIRNGNVPMYYKNDIIDNNNNNNSQEAPKNIIG